MRATRRKMQLVDARVTKDLMLSPTSPMSIFSTSMGVLVLIFAYLATISSSGDLVKAFRSRSLQPTDISTVSAEIDFRAAKEDVHVVPTSNQTQGRKRTSEELLYYDLALMPPESVGSIINRTVKPFLIEVGVLVLCQMFGLQVLTKLMSGLFTLRRLSGVQRIRQLAVRHLISVRKLRMVQQFSIKHMKVLRAGGTRMWKGMVALYSKTSVSKFVNRAKKLFKKLFPHHHHDNEGEEHGEEEINETGETDYPGHDLTFAVR